MHTFSVGNGRIQAMAYSPDSRFLIIDLREEPIQHPWMVFNCQPCRELVWWDWLANTPHRRFRLRDSLYGPHGALADSEYNEDHFPDQAALDVSFCLHPLRVAAAWEWTNKEDGVCVYDVDNDKVIDLRTPYKTHMIRLAFSPDGARLAAATVNDMDGFSHFEVWDLSPNAIEPQDDNIEQPVEDSQTSIAGHVGMGMGLIDPEWQMIRESRYQEEQDACPNPFHLPAVATLAFNGRFVAAAGAEQTKILLWDSHVKPLRERDIETEAYDEAQDIYSDVPMRDVGFQPYCLAFASRESLLAVGGLGLGILDFAADRWLSFDRSWPAVSALLFDADNRLLLAGTKAGTVEYWDVASGTLLKEFDWNAGSISALAAAPDGFTCAAGTDNGMVMVWDLDEK